MAQLTYTALTSLDGFIEDEGGGFEWAMPDAEVHGYINELERPARTHLYGRRMYETMSVWETMGLESGEGSEAAPPREEIEFARDWRAADKIVYSRTLEAVTTSRTRLESEFDAEAVRRLKNSAEGEIAIGGPDLARHAFDAGLIDEVRLFVFPVAVGNGKPGLPRGVRSEFELLDERRFAGGVVHLRYSGSGRTL